MTLPRVRLLLALVCLAPWTGASATQVTATDSSVGAVVPFAARPPVTVAELETLLAYLRPHLTPSPLTWHPDFLASAVVILLLGVVAVMVLRKEYRVPLWCAALPLAGWVLVGMEMGYTEAQARHAERLVAIADLLNTPSRTLWRDNPNWSVVFQSQFGGLGVSDVLAHPRLSPVLVLARQRYS